jgi:hypothetical protein
LVPVSTLKNITLYLKLFNGKVEESGFLPEIHPISVWMKVLIIWRIFPVANIDYAMLSGDLKFINQSLRPSANLHSMMIDNLGTLAGGGDTYPFGMSSAYSWGHSQLLNAASWYYNDPVYNFLLERTRTGPFTGQKMPDLIYPIHRYIANLKITEQPDGNLYPKVQAQEIEKGVYDDLLNQIDNNVPEFQKDPDNEDKKVKKQDRD